MSACNMEKLGMDSLGSGAPPSFSHVLCMRKSEKRKGGGAANETAFLALYAA
jgi:hypothetical protein